MGLLSAVRGIAFGLAVTCIGVHAFAQSSGSRDSARVLADRGWELFKAGRYDEAIAVLEKADREFHAPTVLLVLARVHDRAGHLIESKKIYTRITSEELGPDAPVDFKRAQETARAELTAIDARIPKLTVVLAGHAPAKPMITIDRQDRTDEVLAAAIPLDPGHHTVVVQGTHGASEQRSVSLKEGVSEKLTIEFKAPSPKKDQTHAQARSTAPSSHTNWPAIVSFGVGAAGIGVGAVTGALALSKAHDVKSRCQDGSCLEEDESTAQQARTLATVSTIGFVIGGAGIGAGTFFLVSGNRNTNVGIAISGRFR